MKGRQRSFVACMFGWLAGWLCGCVCIVLFFLSWPYGTKSNGTNSNSSQLAGMQKSEKERGEQAYDRASDRTNELMRLKRDNKQINRNVCVWLCEWVKDKEIRACCHHCVICASIKLEMGALFTTAAAALSAALCHRDQMYFVTLIHAFP